MLKHMIVADQKAAAAFSNSRTRAIVAALMKCDLSLAELQVEVGMSLSLLHYHVGRMRRLGLVEVVETRRRAGRPILRYRAVAEEFRVPAAIATRGPGIGLKQEMEAALEKAEARHPSTISYFLDEHGAVRMRRIGSDRSRTYVRWWRLRLSAVAARNLTREISELVSRYDAATHSGTSHLLHFALAESSVR
jgi:hypothetical protein